MLFQLCTLSIVTGQSSLFSNYHGYRTHLLNKPDYVCQFRRSRS